MYVGYYQDNRNNKLLVSERIKGKRYLEEYPLILEYYIPDNDGYYEGYDGQKLKKISVPNTYMLSAHKKECKANNIKTYELYFNLPNKVLYERYKDSNAPELHKSFVDIEVDRKGFEYLTIKQLIDKACCPINAISIYNNWQDTLYTLMLRPETLSKEQAQEICNKFENTVLFDKESDLLNGIMMILEDSDVISGYNSTRFDYPYIVRRIENVLGEGQSKGLCLWNLQPRYKEKTGDFGDVNIEYEFYGKWFTDYLELYKKHEQGKKESYKLNSIAEIELGEQKVQHTESLEDMYRNNYEDFIKYNRQDTMLVKKLDDKLNYINLHNAQAHDICCSLEQTMGTVAWVDQAIINEAHEQGLIITDKVEGKNAEFDGIIPPGAYVADPIAGLYRHVFSFDMNSLYPTTIRSLNLSPETIIGQIKMDMTIPYLWDKIRNNKLWKNISKEIPDWGAAWGGDDVWGTLEYQEIMKQSDKLLTIKFENGDEVSKSAKEIYNIIFSNNSNISISAAGTLFRTDKIGLLNRIFTRWYSERKEFKKKMFEYETMEIGVEISNELKSRLSNNLTYKTDNKEYDINVLKQLINDNDVNKLKQFMEEYNLYISENMIISKYQTYFKERYDYFDLAQYVKKIQLNSAYGALLNSASVFYDFRLGCSTTLSGRKVVQHLTAEANKQMIGVYTWKGHCATYNDTDSFGKNTEITINGSKINIEDYYNSIDEIQYIDTKNVCFKRPKNDVVLTTKDGKTLINSKVNYVMKHKVKKELFEINCDGKSIIITCDHSIMVMRDDKIIAVKPSEIKKGDKLIIKCIETNIIEEKENLMIKLSENFEIKSLGVQEEEVYDIEVEDIHTLFANDILVHNSVYCSIDNQEFRDKHPDFDYSRDNMVKYADMIGDKINESFPDYMKKTFNCNDNGANIQKAGRETVCSRGLFCGKKRYALMVFDKDGFRMDTNGKPGKIKIMGIQTKRSDLNVSVKSMLKRMLEKLLTDGNRDDLLNMVREFALNDWNNLEPWKKGTPKACNKLEFYTKEYERTNKCSVGQVMASINWNKMIDLCDDKITPKIMDGNKVVVCKLKPNNTYGMNSIAYPVDLEFLPKWFKELPFDEQKMEGSVVDTTIETIFGILNWDLSMSTALNTNNDLEDFLDFI